MDDLGTEAHDQGQEETLDERINRHVATAVEPISARVAAMEKRLDDWLATQHADGTRDLAAQYGLAPDQKGVDDE